MLDPIERRPWKHACLWLAILAPFFFITYGGANALAARRHHVPSIVFAWERHVPFMPWTIVPYWSIDVFYGLSLFVCATRAELETHVRRLLTAQVVAVLCFALFPLRFAFAQPATHGYAGLLFRTLASFDRPFNQAPSLHIALLVILWHLYAAHTGPLARRTLHVWFCLIGASVLTTYQHHFIDVPTGALLGVVCLWLWPNRRRSPLAAGEWLPEKTRANVAACYLIAAVVFASVAWATGGVALWLVWISVSLLVVALNYAAFGQRGFQKDDDGRMSLAARLLLAPYLFGAFVNSRIWTWRDRKAVAITEEVWLGRFPLAREAESFAAVIDVSAELPAPACTTLWTCVPMLDLVAPRPEALRRAADLIEHARGRGRVLVCCALGYSRSAASVATWLVATGASPSLDEAVEHVRRLRTDIALERPLRDAIAAAAEPLA